MKAFIVLEDVDEAHVYQIDEVFVDIFSREEDAVKKVNELSRPYNSIYYKEITIK